LLLDQPQYQYCEIFFAVNKEDIKTLVENFNISKFFEQLASEEGDLELIDEGWYTLFIGEDKL
jgi:Asp-tRNA(Asn)/Glu-tRNA(Gln) amidotransferase B subunit